MASESFIQREGLRVGSLRRQRAAIHFASLALHGAGCVAALVTARADLEARTKSDLTPLMQAVVVNATEVAQALLDAKADANARTEKMFSGTALDIAVKLDRAVARAILEEAQLDAYANLSAGAAGVE